MFKQRKRIAFRICSFSSKLEPEPEHQTGSGQNIPAPQHCECGEVDHICLLRFKASKVFCDTFFKFKLPIPVSGTLFKLSYFEILCAERFLRLNLFFTANSCLSMFYFSLYSCIRRKKVNDVRNYSGSVFIFYYFYLYLQSASIFTIQFNITIKILNIDYIPEEHTVWHCRSVNFPFFFITIACLHNGSNFIENNSRSENKNNHILC